VPTNVLKNFRGKIMGNKFQHGFTLLELLVVVAILSVLIGLVAPKIMDRPDEARVVRAKSDIQALESTLNIYKLDNYAYPSTDQGLEALVNKPADAPNWKQGGYIKKVPKDPWGRPYLYLSPGVKGPVDIYTLGADGQEGGEGFNADIGNWNLE